MHSMALIKSTTKPYRTAQIIKTDRDSFYNQRHQINHFEKWSKKTINYELMQICVLLLIIINILNDHWSICSVLAMQNYYMFSLVIYLISSYITGDPNNTHPPGTCAMLSAFHKCDEPKLTMSLEGGVKFLTLT